MSRCGRYRESSTSRARRPPRRFSRRIEAITRCARLPDAAVCLGTTATAEPERLPSARRPTLRSDEAPARSLSRSRAGDLAPLSPDAMEPPVSKVGSRAVLPPACSARLAARLDGPGKDASHRLLQPTLDTCTRGPFDSRAVTDFAATTDPEATEDRGPTTPRRRRPDGLAALRTPGGRALDGAFPAAARSLRVPPSRGARRPRRVGAAALSTARTAGERTFDAPCRTSRSRLPDSPSAPRAVPVDRASTRPTLPTRSAFHRQVLPFRGSPPPNRQLCHRLAGFRRSFA